MEPYYLLIRRLMVTGLKFLSKWVPRRVLKNAKIESIKSVMRKIIYSLWRGEALGVNKWTQKSSVFINS